MTATKAPRVQAFTASIDLSTHQDKLVKLDVAEGFITICGAGEKAHGVLINAPLAGEAAEVAVGGGYKAKAGGVITKGGSVGSGALGVLADVANGVWAIGVADEAGVLNDVVPITIDRHETSA